jgi:hypothetical protein
MTGLGIARALLACAQLVPPANAASPSAPEISVELRVSVHAVMEPSALDLARRSATELLRSGGIAVQWRACRASDVACGTGDAARAIVVRAAPAGPTASHACGGTTRGTADGDIVIVFVACHERLVRAVRASAFARADPLLATLEMGHLLGLTIAHEVGHVLGLTHAPTGVMRARFDIGDLPALRKSQLAFMPHERRQMQLAMLARTAVARRG